MASNVSNLPPILHRPELGHSSQYAPRRGPQTTTADHTREALLALQKCETAAMHIWSIEKQMFEDETISKSKPTLPSLENLILNISSVTEGLFYSIGLKYNGKTLVRYIESGVYKGYMVENGKQVLQESFPQETMLFNKIFTTVDIGNHGMKDTKCSRPGRQYDRILRQNKISILGELSILKNSLQNCVSNVQLQHLVFHSIKKGANPNGQDDRYMYCHPDANIAAFSETLASFLVGGEVGQEDEEEISTINLDNVSVENIQSQFDFINKMSNHHKSTYIRMDGKLSKSGSRVGVLQHLLYQETVEDGTYKYFPTSFRNRNLFFLLQDKEYLINLNMPDKNHISATGECDAADTMNQFDPPPKKQRRNTPRVIKLTPQMLGIASMKNLMPKGTLYQVFAENVITEGTVLWRSHSQSQSTVILNSYSTETGFIQPCSYEHVTITHQYGNTFLKCSCSMYGYLQGVGVAGAVVEEDVVLDTSLTCMHCRFTKDYLLQYEHNVQLMETCMDTNLSKKVTSDFRNVNKQIVILNPDDTKCTKISIQHIDHCECTFVHLSGNGEYVTCQSGKCKAMMKNKRNVIKLLALEETDKICEHLQTLHSNQEEWKHLLPEKMENLASPSEENTETLPTMSQDKKIYFNTSTESWKFGGLSRHKPHPQVDLELSRCTVERAKFQDGLCKRDAEHYLKGPNLMPDLPENCKCKSGFAIDPFSCDYTTKIYTRYGAVRADVLKAKCLAKERPCEYLYSGKKDSIHQWSKDICAGDEIGWDFVNRVLCSKTSFTAFVNEMTRVYRSTYVMSPSFMSVPTFIAFIFSWMGAMEIDFRTAVDPWCKHEPKMLACDGTHVGVSTRLLDMPKLIEKPDTQEQIISKHKRFDRVFFKYTAGNEDAVRKSRGHLRYLCKKVLKPNECESISNEDLLLRNKGLLSLITDDRVETIIASFIDKRFSNKLLYQLAVVLKAICKDAPLVAFFPYTFIEDIHTALQEILHVNNRANHLQYLNEVNPEFARLIQLAMEEHIEAVFIDFTVYLLEEIKETHRDDPDLSVAAPISGTYRPDRGISYYFTSHGNQVRETKDYRINKINAAVNFDDNPIHDQCNKVYPSVPRGGYSYMFLWFCPIHGHSYGFHLIPGSEGRKDPFNSLFKFCPNPPEEVFYDFACGLSEYGLNREPAYFRQIRIWHDLFHGFGHKCPFCFRSARIQTLNVVNSEICEQFNSFIQCIKYTGSHLSQQHFVFFMQFFIAIWNQKKTESFEKRIQIAYAGSL